MTWQAEADAVLGLTRAAREALGRGDLEALGALLDERGLRVRRLGASAGDLPRGTELDAALVRIRAEEAVLAAALRAGLAETGQALGRLSAAPAGVVGGAVPICDRRG